MNTERILFDLDGTLWDTQKFHAIAEAELMMEHGKMISPDDLSARFAGRPTEEVFMEVLGCDKTLASILTSRKWEKIFPTAPDVAELVDIRKLFTVLKKRELKFR